MSTSLIDPLKPEQMGGLYGRTGSITAKLITARLAPKSWIIAYSVILFVLFLVWASVSGVLLGPDQVPWAFSLFFEKPTSSIKQVRLPVLLDPVGIILIVTALATPLFCAHQVKALSVFNSMNESNVGYRAIHLPAAELNVLVAKVNKAFRILGTRITSLVVALISIINSYLACTFIQDNGILKSWNPTSLSDSNWQLVASAGWWAGRQDRPEFAYFLVATGAYFLYHVTKQLTMGVIFSIYARRALTKGFGVSPNLKLNTDGYYGLRRLRYFMQWTYAATIVDFLMTVGVFVVWLPFMQLTVFIVLLVMATNILTVLYPTSVAIGGTLLEKRTYVTRLSDLSSLTNKERDELVDKVWMVPHLPFRLRSTLSVVTLYLLIPIALAIVSAILK